MWLSGYSYRKAITVTNSTGGTLTDFQVLAQVDTQTLITALKMNSSGNDIRITDSDGNTLLNFWFDPDTINTTTTDIWTKIPSLPNGTYTIYIYYGNGGASNASSISSTFIYGDDFSSNTIANYTASGSPSIDTTNKWLRTNASGGGDIRICPTTQTNPVSYVVEAKAKMTVGAGDCFVGVTGFKSTNTGNDGYNMQFGNLSSARSLDIEKLGQAHLNSSGISFTDDVFYPIKGVFVNGSLKASFNKDATVVVSSNTSYTSGKYGMRSYNIDGYYKYFRVRAYASADPTSAIGVEEASGGSPSVSPSSSVSPSISPSASRSPSSSISPSVSPSASISPSHSASASISPSASVSPSSSISSSPSPSLGIGGGTFAMLNVG